MKPYRGPPMTLGNAATARVRFIVWCRDCGHQVEPDPAAMPNATAPRRRCRSGASAWSARTRSNAKRAAEKMITDGTAPAIDYGIKPREDGRFEMAELAAAGKWNAVAGYVCNGLNSYAKMVRQYRDRLVAAHNAQDASMTRRPGNGERA